MKFYHKANLLQNEYVKNYFVKLYLVSLNSLKIFKYKSVNNFVIKIHI